MNKEQITKELQKYKDQGFNYDQIQEIRKGLEAGIDVNKYADPKFNWEQMREIRIELENKKTEEFWTN